MIEINRHVHLREPSVRFARSHLPLGRWERANRTLGSRRWGMWYNAIKSLICKWLYLPPLYTFNNIEGVHINTDLHIKELIEFQRHMIQCKYIPFVASSTCIVYLSVIGDFTVKQKLLFWQRALLALLVPGKHLLFNHA